MSHKPKIKMNVKEDEIKRGEIRKIINFVSELKRSDIIKLKNIMFGLPTNPVYEKFYNLGNVDITNKAVLQFCTISDDKYFILNEYISTAGGNVVDKKIEGANTILLVDVSNMS